MKNTVNKFKRLFKFLGILVGVCSLNQLGICAERPTTSGSGISFTIVTSSLVISADSTVARTNVAQTVSSTTVDGTLTVNGGITSNTTGPFLISIVSGPTISSTTLVTGRVQLTITSTSSVSSGMLNQSDYTYLPADIKITKLTMDFEEVRSTGTVVFSSCTFSTYPNYGNIGAISYSNVYNIEVSTSITIRKGGYLKAKQESAEGQIRTNIYGDGEKLP